MLTVPDKGKVNLLNCDVKNNILPEPPLDTLDTRRDNAPEIPERDPVGRYGTRATRKAGQARKFVELAKLMSPREEGYRDSFYCSHKWVRQGVKYEARRCGRRWCNVCSGIKGIKYREAYMPVFEQMESAVFVTLTAKTVPIEKLKEQIQLMIKTFSIIVERHRKRHERDPTKPRFRGLRRIECTYTRDKLLHPHLHLLLEGGLDYGWEIIHDWLELMPNTHIAAQKPILADKDSHWEMFKYVTKDVISLSEKERNRKIAAGESLHIPWKIQDQMWAAFEGVRVIHPIGIKKVPLKPIESFEDEENNEGLYDQEFKWKRVGRLDKETGLMNMNPDKDADGLPTFAWVGQETGDLMNIPVISGTTKDDFLKRPDREKIKWWK